LAVLTQKVWDLSSALTWQLQHAFSQNFSVLGVTLARTWDPKPAKTHNSRCISLWLHLDLEATILFGCLGNSANASKQRICTSCAQAL